MLATTILKRVVNAERPRGGPRSFPSGHATVAFALAAAVDENHRRARLPLLGVATAIAASRVDVRAHHTRDVLAGAAIGYFTTKYFMRRNRREATTPAVSSTTAAPQATDSAALDGAASGLNVTGRGVSWNVGF